MYGQEAAYRPSLEIFQDFHRDTNPRGLAALQLDNNKVSISLRATHTHPSEQS
jgi:hypothetical protein